MDITLCRICLEDGATIPIFVDSSDNEENILSKIILCMSEKIEDVMGFPRNICAKCDETLDIVCNFRNKYTESCKILAKGFSVVKTEPFIDFTDLEDCNNASEVDMELKDIKHETDSNLKNGELIQSKPLLINLKTDKIKGETKKKHKPKKPKIHSGTDTNKIASSILEGDFSWTGQKWCFKIGQTTVMSKKKRTVNQKEVKKEAPKENQIDPLKLCDLCGEVFTNSEKLLIHKKRKHLSTPIKCTKCPKIFTSDYNLGLHIQRKHGGTRDFSCSTCGKSFITKKELRDHITRVHNKVPKPPKVFTCKFCEKTYKCAKSVVVHERSAHTGQRPAQCTICGSCFFHEDYLKEHMRLHTGETPYKCPVCGRGYAQRGNMKSHLRIHRISEVDANTLSKMRPNHLKRLKVS